MASYCLGEKDCPGPPAAPGIPAEECNFKERAMDKRPTITMVGGEGSPFRLKDYDHPLFGLFLCQRCHRKLQRRELAVLSEKEKDGTLRENQKKRLKRQKAALTTCSKVTN